MSGSFYEDGSGGGGATTTSGVYSARPASGTTAGDQYWSEDGPYQSLWNGASWDDFIQGYGKVTVPPSSDWTDTTIAGTGSVTIAGGTRQVRAEASSAQETRRAAVNANFRVEVLVSMTQFIDGLTDGNFNLALEDGTGESIQIHLQSSAQLYIIDRPNGWNNGTGQTIIRNDYEWRRFHRIWWAVQYNGTNVKIDYSNDGMSWYGFYNAANPLAGAPVDIVFGIDVNAGANNGANMGILSYIETAI